MALQEKSAAKSKAQQPLAAPTLSLPKGGGAISGMGEKFAANPVTGTASLSVPIPTSPGRSGFGPALALSYDSGHGQGPFGLGWSLSLPAITRKTDKGLPQYCDAAESDVFILSGSEDLVPVLLPSGERFEDTNSAPGFTIHLYRPRVEGLFARIERWTAADGDIHWRSISRDNVLTLYGTDARSRICDPADDRRIFSWLIAESRDDKGNATVYEYKPEDGAGVDLTSAHEQNRGDRADARRTANRYVKRILYGNRTPLLDNAGQRPRFLTAEQLKHADWMFKVVFDYGEHDPADPKPDDPGDWHSRSDPVSSYRAGFEVRTCRICRRVLMFHVFPEEPGVGQDCLVRSTAFDYQETPIATYMTAVTESGYKRKGGGGYLQQSLPPLEFLYSQAVVGEAIETIDPDSLGNLPQGVDGAVYQWVDLDGEGLPGILAKQGDAWFYKRNESALMRDSATGACAVRFAPVEQVARMPAGTALGPAQWQFLDLAGDGQVDLVRLTPPVSGFFERTGDAEWEPFRAFAANPNLDWNDPNLKFIDLTGDGHADILITEDQAFTWYPSLAEEGFGTAIRLSVPTDEERGPSILFADGTQTIFLADCSGDGLSDIVRIRNGEVSYWPNLGYGGFGAKVAMDGAPWFDTPDQFDPRRIRLADIDGSGVTDIIYLGRDGTRFWLNQAGNGWSPVHQLAALPPVDNVATVAAVDLLGTGTTCLVWSSPLPGDARAPMQYINLMAGGKPHLLVNLQNNLGAETRVRYAPSTHFYLRDKHDGNPWVTRLPFPVHVVERMETYDHISRNRFVTRYAYHHGYFDGEEREFRGFGMVEQWDTEEFAALSESAGLPTGENLAATSHVPPVLTRTWYHTGADVGRDHIAEFPAGLTADEEREACRALKGSMLHQEVYGLDGTLAASDPYTVVTQNFIIRCVQERKGNRYAVFFSHVAEGITYHYERNMADPRISQTLTLEVDPFGNVLKGAAIGYGRLKPDTGLTETADRTKQTQTLISYTEHSFTHAIDDPTLYPVAYQPPPVRCPDAYRTPLPAESRTYELTGWTPADPSGWFRSADFLGIAGVKEIQYEDAPTAGQERRLIEQARTLYRPDDLGAAENDPTTLLDLRKLEPLALPGESYKLAFTQGLLDQVFKRDGLPLLPTPADVLGGQGADRGGYVNLDGDGRWWIPAGRDYLSPGSSDTAAQELAYAAGHFFLPRRYRDPFHTSAVSTETLVTYDSHDLLLLETRDALGNRATVGERLANGDPDPAKPGNDYRVLQPWRLTDPNGNRTAVAFDALGMVVGTAVMGKPGEALGDSLAGFDADLSSAVVSDHLKSPLTDPEAILGSATTRLVYDLFAYDRTRTEPNPQPAVVYILARETHAANLAYGQKSPIRHSFVYSDGFGREIQKKVQAEPGPVPRRDKDGQILLDADGQTLMTASGVSPRWVGTGWTIFNNKGKPVRQYEPFFSDTQDFEFGVRAGVSPTLFYDPLERVIATLHPNHTYEKVVFDPWRQLTFDANDTIATQSKTPGDPHAPTGDPRTDPDIGGYVARYFAEMPAALSASWKSWHTERKDGDLGTEEQDAAVKAAAHANTPTAVYFDTLGRAFLTLAQSGFQPDGTPIMMASRVELDIEGNQRAVRDASEQKGDKLGRIVTRCDYDMLGNRIHETGMETGARWILNDVAGKPIRAWDSRGHTFRTTYDPLRRPLRHFAIGANPAKPGAELLTERLVYGEQHPEALLRNLRGKLYLHFDQAGVAAGEAFDFKGNPVRSARRLAREYRQAVDWGAVDAALPADSTTGFDPAALEAAVAPLTEAETFTSGTTYDALNRPVRLTTPHTPAMQPSVIRPGYNEAGLLERVDVNLRGAAAGGLPVWTPFVTNIDYDAKGQRLHIDYGNGTGTDYGYDPLTFRLIALVTRRSAVLFPGDNPQPALAGWPGAQVQNLHYTYDPVGNVTRIRDDAQQTVYFRNKRVDPNAGYTYDALYRLIEATGREHLSLAGGAPVPHSYSDAPRVGIAWSANDGNAMGTYIENYVYDAVGNILEMQHRGSDPANPGWKRSYTYGETSLIEDGTGGTLLKRSNRLSSTVVGSSPTEPYVYDAHGNMTRMPHLGGTHPDSNMEWDHRDQLRRTDLGGGGTAYYVYDAHGERVRKVWEKSGGLSEERICLGGFELFRRRNGADEATLERETLHVMDGRQRVAMVEQRTLDTAGDDPAPDQMIRYQFANHLGTASLELDDQAQIISYEEYTPYGSTSYQAVRSQTETPKRYRYTGKERDEETGLYYHGARYYAPWLGRWTSCDPAGTADGPNVYAYVRGNPVRLHDPAGTNGVPKPEPIVGSGGSNIIGDFPGWSKRWEQAAEKALREKFGTKGLKEGLKKFEEHIETLKATAGMGSNRKKGTAIYEARKIYSAARQEFGALMKAAGVDLTDVQLHHFFGGVAKAPEKALDPTGLGVLKGQAGVKGTGHNIAHTVEAALPEKVKKMFVEKAAPKVEAVVKTVAKVRSGAERGFAELGVMKGIAGVGLSVVGGALSYKELKKDIAKKDYGAALASGAGVVESGVALGAMGAKALGVAGAATPTTALLGTSVGSMGLGQAVAAAPHVVGAFAVGAMIGTGIEKGLNVSEYSSRAGVAVYEKLKGSGMNDTAAFVTGGVASVVAIPGAIVWAAGAKVKSWF